MDERYHAVLLVDWEGQTWVLDNRHPLPMEYDLMPYKFHLLQVAGTQNWEKV
jgi:predicted transglutaminase-like cysteine proteinase